MRSGLGTVRVRPGHVDDKLRPVGAQVPGQRHAATRLVQHPAVQIEVPVEVRRTRQPGEPGDDQLARRPAVGKRIRTVELCGEPAGGPQRRTERAVADRYGLGRVGVGPAERDVGPAHTLAVSTTNRPFCQAVVPTAAVAGRVATAHAVPAIRSSAADSRRARWRRCAVDIRALQAWPPGPRAEPSTAAG